jgi:cytochrome c oxidase subunit II
MNRWLSYKILAPLALSVLLVVFLGCSHSPSYPPGTTSPGGGSYESNGQRIYFIATSSSGQPIIPEGFTMMMYDIACVNCHGPEGQGGTVYMMMQRFDVPNITWPMLTMQGQDHPPYTEATLKQAITEGVDPAGNELDQFMPRWQMSAGDLDDLVNFIKTLK